MTYFLADPHYGHDRIYLERMFPLEHINNIKKYLIGDVSCGRNSLENALEFLNKLTCKVFVKGNHDGSFSKIKSMQI